MLAPEGRLGLSDHFLASSEVLVGPPANWENHLEINRDFFGPQTTILLILRRPSGFLRSVFQQISHHSGLLVEPKTYFSGSDQCISSLYDPKYYNQERLVRLYAEAFNEVIVQKFETVMDLEFLRVAYGVPDHQMRVARSNMSNSTSNRSFSNTAVNISMKMKWMFGSPVVDLEQGTIKRTRRYKLWRSLMQGVFDRIYPYENYRLDWQEVPNVGIIEMDATYDKIPRFQHYIHGELQPVDMRGH